ncbi:MAG: response regulator [Deltaproteobacteria bacterium]|nr:response regulator [Deltaproteobacteria bacterium]
MTKPEEKTVLVVDDEEDVREYLTMALEDAGFNVQKAADGNEALERIKERAPDFISLDLVMPGKSGIKLLHELRRNKDWKSIPFVVVTAHASDDLGKGDLEEIMSQKTFSGPSVYLEKPVKPEQYVGFVCEQLGVEHEIEEAVADADQLRDDLQKLIDTSDPDKLAEAIRLLKKK